MKKKLPFEEAMERKMQDLPASGEDEAWRKMKDMLDEEEDRKPFFFFRTYKFLGAVALMAVLTFCAIIFAEKNRTQTINTNTKNAATDKNYSNKNKPKDTSYAVTNPPKIASTTVTGITKNFTEKNKTFIEKINKDPLSKAKNNDAILHKAITQNNFSENKNLQNLNQQPVVTKHNPKNIQQHFSTKLADKISLVNKSTAVEQITDKNFTSNTSKQAADLNSENDNKNISSESASHPLNSNETNNRNDNNSSHIFTEKNKINLLHDSARTAEDSLKALTAKDSIKQNTKNDSLSTMKKIKKSDNKIKHYFIAAGIQEQQQIPLSGQQITAYNINGKTNFFDDYIPSVYLHLEREKSWFLESEFNILTPQTVQSFMYSKHTAVDYLLSTETVTAYQLQKTFYSELPVSLNYYVLPHWSIGAGMQCNWFYGAVSNSIFTENNAQSGTYNSTNKIMAIKNYNDSFIYNFKTALIFQTTYNISKWSFSLRFASDLQPYMTYTLPDGGIINKKNKSLEFLVGYRFFKSKKFKLL
jgi:hypothetical protein